jgi:hypothetical protein
MIFKNLLFVDNKLISHKFIIQQYNNKIIINTTSQFKEIVKIPVYNKYSGLHYEPIIFPFNLIIYDNKIFNPYIILSTHSLNIINDFDFFYKLEIFINMHYKLEFYNFNDFIIPNKNNIFCDIINNNYLNEINQLFLLKKDDIINFIKSFWINFNIIKTYVIYILIKYPNINYKNINEMHKKYNIPLNILLITNCIKLKKYNLLDNYYYINYYDNIYDDLLLKNLAYENNTSIELLENNNNHIMSFNDYYLYDDNSLPIDKIIKNKYYYIYINTDKVLKIFVNDIDNNNIKINNNKNLIFDNYKWYYFNPNIAINKDHVIFNTFINYSFINFILEYIIIIDNKNINNQLIKLQTNKMYEYFNISNNLCYLSILYNLDDFYILKNNLFSNEYFKYVTKKYPNNKNILTILFNNYSYPLKSNRHNMDNTFDYILYYSLNYYNYISDNNFDIINLIIPVKLKNLFITILKTLNQIINNCFELITFNQKIYNDYLHRNIIKLFFFNSDKLSINYFKSLININIFIKFKLIIITNIMLIDISTKINWSNLSKKLNYLNFFYINNNIIFYQNKINKNIIHDNFDNRIKKIIENPFDMYKYLKKEKDFIIWTNFISNKLVEFYYVPISLSHEDFINLAKIIYLLYNIKEQNINDESYMEFISFCNKHAKLILNANRINIKIKEHFLNLKSNINLGILAKHLTWNKDYIKLDLTKRKKSEGIEIKLHLVTKKYLKYKTKYLESKNFKINSNINTDICSSCI